MGKLAVEKRVAGLDGGAPPHPSHTPNKTPPLAPDGEAFMREPAGAPSTSPRMRGA